MTLKPLSAKLTCMALKLSGFLQSSLVGNLEWFTCISAAWRITLSSVCWWLFSQVLIYCDRQGHCIILCPRWLRIQNSYIFTCGCSRLISTSAFCAVYRSRVYNMSHTAVLFFSFVRSWQRPTWPKCSAIIVIDSVMYLYSRSVRLISSK